MKATATLLCTLACALILSACAKPVANEKGSAPATVTTIVIKPDTWTDTIDAIGTAHANESVTITAKVSETIRKVDFDSGDFARAGQVLVTLTGQAEVAGLDAAAASYRDAEQLLQRQQALVARQLIAASTVETARATRDAARARMDQVRATLSDRVIAAPFDGVLGLRQVSQGSLVTPGSVIATLDDVSLIKLDFTVGDGDLPHLSNGQLVIAHSDAYPAQAFDGKITSLDSRVDPVTRAITVRAQIANPERKLRPGMLLDVAVQLPPRQTLQAPELALQQIGQQAFLFRVGADDKVAQVPVTIGARKSGLVEVVGGIQAGDRVVVEGTVKLHDGSKIVEAGTVKAGGAANHGEASSAASANRK